MIPSKPFKLMNHEEKHAHTLMLWRKARAVYIMRSFTIRLAQLSDNKAHNDMGGYEMTEEDPVARELNEDDDVHVKNHLPPYMIDETKTMAQIWEMVNNTLTIYTLIATPFVLVF